MSLTLIIAGGGTGGHVFPGIAIADAFLALAPGGSVSFVGTERGLEARAVPGRGYEIDFVPSGPVSGRGARGILGVGAIVKGVAAAFSVLRRRRPDMVMGVGGYASVPVSLAAVAMRIPLFIQEQNAVPGRANRLLGRMAMKVYAGFSGAAGYFPPGRTEVSGNPVRKEIAAMRTADGLREHAGFRVFALGGSQGARAINTLVLEMARQAKREGRAMTFELQTGAGEFDSVDKAVRDEGLPVGPFPFTDRIGESFDRCDAVLMRAGALSIAEASLFGKPCVLIPYPFAADAHQEKNAIEFCAGGAGVWMRQDEATPQRIMGTLAAWEADAALRASAGEAAVRFSRPDAAERIVGSALCEIGAGRGARSV